MSKPSFHADDRPCPTCGIRDSVRMVSEVSCVSRRTEHVMWCANGHICYEDRHQRVTQVIDTCDVKNYIKIIDEREKPPVHIHIMDSSDNNR